MLALVLDIANICRYSCTSPMSHLLLIGMGSSHSFGVTFWHKQEAPDYSVWWRCSHFQPRMNTPDEKVGVHLEILQCTEWFIAWTVNSTEAQREL